MSTACSSAATIQSDITIWFADRECGVCAETDCRADPDCVSRHHWRRMTNLDQTDYDFLRDNARAGLALQLPGFIHLDQSIGMWNYIRIANDIVRQAAGHVLDWGCGYGQMTYLLRRRSFQVTSFDIGAADTSLPDIPICRELAVVRSLHPTQLPFESASFLTRCSVAVCWSMWMNRAARPVRSENRCARSRVFCGRAGCC
jgi:SAM-dependent methyltransferase